MSPPSSPSGFPTENMFDELVAITVGCVPEHDTPRTFQVFRGVICFYSGYFSAAFNGHFKETTEMATSLPSEDPLIFQLFCHWIHTRRDYDSTLEPSVLLDFITIAKLWVFGDAHHVPLLQNVAIDIFAQKMRDSSSVPDDTTIRYIEDNTMESSALRRLLKIKQMEMVTLCPAYHIHEQNESCYAAEKDEKPKE